MPQVRCPQCGALNSTAAPDYPFCLGCQDNLAKCGYCRWFTTDPEVCTNPVVAGVFDVSSDATPPCDQHEPRESVLAPRPRLWPALVAAAVALLVLWYALLQFQRPAEIPPATPQEDLRLSVEADLRGAVVGRPYVVTAEIRNVADYAVGGIRLQLSLASLQDFRLVGTLPRYDAREEMGEWMAYVYRDLPPHQSRRIVFDLKPRRPGRYHLKVRLVSRGAKEYHGMADFPVAVAAAASPPGARPRRSAR